MTAGHGEGPGVASEPPATPAVRRPSTPRLTGPWLLLAVLVVAAVAAVTGERVRLGGYLLGAGLGAAALLRAVLPTRLSGAVATRSRTTDVLLLLAGGVAAVVLASTLKLGGS